MSAIGEPDQLGLAELLDDLTGTGQPMLGATTWFHMVALINPIG